MSKRIESVSISTGANIGSYQFPIDAEILSVNFFIGVPNLTFKYDISNQYNKEYRSIISCRDYSDISEYHRYIGSYIYHDGQEFMHVFELLDESKIRDKKINNILQSETI